MMVKGKMVRHQPNKNTLNSDVESTDSDADPTYEPDTDIPSDSTLSDLNKNVCSGT